MKIKVENLGNIEKAELELGNLTILTGKNNTGKTYIAYALYGFLDSWRVLKIEDFEYTKEETKENLIFSVDIKDNQNIYLNQILSDYVDNKLHNIFNIYMKHGCNMRKYLFTTCINKLFMGL